MNEKGLKYFILITVVIVLAGLAGYFTLAKKFNLTTKSPISLKNDYSTTPMAECAECKDGRTWENKPCCTASFENNCVSKNGVIRSFDLHPLFTFLKGCFQKAPDTGKECAVAADCLSGVCNLESAITSNKCTLIKKEFTGGGQSRQKFYTASYSCGTNKPGVCSETISNGENPGGVFHWFQMNNKTLIEKLESGPIY